jgi:hypothetical protein
MLKLIKTEFIETNLLYEVAISPAFPEYQSVVHYLNEIGVITDDADVFVLNESQYESLATFLKNRGIG